MPKNFGFILLFLVISLNAFSQDKMILSDQSSIPATEVWKFMSDSYSYSGIVEVQIANNKSGGALLLQLEASQPTFYIGGTAYLFLEDGNVITCTDKNVRSISGKFIQSYYILTATEINLLKKNKITDVRFRIIGDETQFSSPTGFFTAINRIRTFGLPDKTFDTVTEIKQLFN